MLLDELVSGLLPRTFPSHFVLPSLGAGRRGLVVGMGGGCDVFAAYALAQLWSETSASEATVLYGNCVGSRPFPEDHAELLRLPSSGPVLYRVPPVAVPLEPGDEAYASTRLECSCPRGVEGSPYLFVVPRESKKNTGTLAELTEANSEALSASLAQLKLGPEDHVLAVDCGGDSLTGGLDFDASNGPESAEMGRDRQVLRALHNSGVPYTHIVLGPGCDAESSVADMADAVRELDEEGRLLGVMSLERLLPMMSALTRTLAPSRTPNIMAASLAHLQAAGDAAAMVTIRRHGHEARMPHAWFVVGLAFKGGPAPPLKPR